MVFNKFQFAFANNSNTCFGLFSRTSYEINKRIKNLKMLNLPGLRSQPLSWFHIQDRFKSMKVQLFLTRVKKTSTKRDIAVARIYKDRGKNQVDSL